MVCVPRVCTYKVPYIRSASNAKRRTCALHGRILSLRQDPTHLHYRVTWPGQPLTAPSSHKDDVSHGSQDDTEALLSHYFSLHLDLGQLYEQWSKVDPNFRRRAPKFAGVRILTQDAWEALIAFICSSNNNISRISQMVRSLNYRYILNLLTSLIGP